MSSEIANEPQPDSPSGPAHTAKGGIAAAVEPLSDLEISLVKGTPLKRKSETIFFGPMVDSNLEDSRMSAENRTLRDGERGIGLLQDVPN